MAESFHFSIDIISRGKGKSAVASAAYISGEKIKNEWDGITHDYTRKERVLHKDILLPKNIPKEFKDRSYLWNSVELNEKANNSQLARQFIIALPKELSIEENKKLIEDFININLVKEGMIVDYAIHDESSKGNENIHAHLLAIMRPINEKGEWQAKSKKEYILDENGEKILSKNGKPKTRKIELTTWNDKGNAEKWRESFASICNKYLEKNNIEKRVDHRSFERQESDYLPTIHLGYKASALEKKGIKTDKGNYNREIKKYNSLVDIIKNQFSNISNWISDYLKNLSNAFLTYNKLSQEELEERPLLFNLKEYLDLYQKIQNEKHKHLYGKLKNQKEIYDFKKYVSGYYYLKNNNLKTIGELAEHIKDLQSKNISLNKKAKSIHQQIEKLDKKLLYTKLYKENKDLYKTYQGKSLFTKDSFYKAHKKEIDQFENVKRTLEKLVGVNGKLDPKKWEKETQELKQELQNINTQKEEIKEHYNHINHIKYATKVVNEEYGIDLSVVIDNAVKNGGKESIISQLEFYKKQVEKDEVYRQKAKEKNIGIER
ncbi:MobQ family relaxase [Actinobacillus seminis]|uniref:MobQ family relaxase n=1 Tax=Actinobacillus seminis TaxID=722 RepID=UPI003B93ED45